MTVTERFMLVAGIALTPTSAGASRLASMAAEGGADANDAGAIAQWFHVHRPRELNGFPAGAATEDETPQAAVVGVSVMQLDTGDGIHAALASPRDLSEALARAERAFSSLEMADKPKLYLLRYLSS